MLRTVQCDHGVAIVNSFAYLICLFQMITVCSVSAFIACFEYLPCHIVQHGAIGAACKCQFAL